MQSIRPSGLRQVKTVTKQCIAFLYLEKQTEADPLIVSDISSLLRVHCLVDARMSNINTNPLPESAGYGVGGVYPAVGVEHILGDVLGVNTVYGVPDILPGCHDKREGEEEGDRRAVVEPEDARVYGGVMGLDKALESSEYLEHGGGSVLCLAWVPPPTLTLVITGWTCLLSLLVHSPLLRPGSGFSLR